MYEKILILGAVFRELKILRDTLVLIDRKLFDNEKKIIATLNEILEIVFTHEYEALIWWFTKEELNDHYEKVKTFVQSLPKHFQIQAKGLISGAWVVYLNETTGAKDEKEISLGNGWVDEGNGNFRALGGATYSHIYAETLGLNAMPDDLGMLGAGATIAIQKTGQVILKGDSLIHLSASGMELSVNLELGEPETSKYVTMDANDNIIISIMSHDAEDKGYSFGPGIYITEGDKLRRGMLVKLGIPYELGVWTSYDTVKKLSSLVDKEYTDRVFKLMARTGLDPTQAQFDALYLFGYNRPALLTDGVIEKLINAGNTNKCDWQNAIMADYKAGNDEQFYKDNEVGWTLRVATLTRLYLSGNYDRMYNL